MKLIIVVAALLAIASTVHADFGNTIGTGYLAKADSTKVYSGSTGPDVDKVVGKNFRFVAFNTTNSFVGRNMASESESDGRLHVRYWDNGKDGNDGENTAWLDPADIIRFRFDCCGEQSCSGIKAQIFKTRTYSDCYVEAAEVAENKGNSNVGGAAAEVERLKLQLEIEKLKLEQERLKAGANSQPAGGERGR